MNRLTWLTETAVIIVTLAALLGFIAANAPQLITRLLLVGWSPVTQFAIAPVILFFTFGALAATMCVRDLTSPRKRVK